MLPVSRVVGAAAEKPDAEFRRLADKSIAQEIKSPLCNGTRVKRTFLHRRPARRIAASYKPAKSRRSRRDEPERRTSAPAGLR